MSYVCDYVPEQKYSGAGIARDGYCGDLAVVCDEDWHRDLIGWLLGCSDVAGTSYLHQIIIMIIFYYIYVFVFGNFVYNKFGFDSRCKLSNKY